MEAFNQVAREIKQKLDRDNHSFIRIEYDELKDLFLEAASGGRKRLTKPSVLGIKDALKDMGVCAYPPVESVNTGNSFRFFRSDTVLWRIFMNYRDPSPNTDSKLAQLSTKVKEDNSLHVLIFESEEPVYK